MTKPKTMYAQSSDIKSRTFSEYRHDMKKKGIRELEFIDYLRNRLIERYKDPSITVEKAGSDSELWFLRTGGRISQKPDYVAKRLDKDAHVEQQNDTLPDENHEKLEQYEFQVAEHEDLKFFDFKVSKVGRMKKGIRIPHADRDFFYVIKPENKYAFISPRWILENGAEGYVAPWRSQGIRVPREMFLEQCVDGGEELEEVLRGVDDKIFLLEFQKRFLDKERERLSEDLQRIINEDREFRAVPSTSGGIYEVCLLLESLDKSPDGPNKWLGGLSEFFDSKLPLIDFARLIFAFDFIYFKCEEPSENEKDLIIKMLKKSFDYIEQQFRNESSSEGSSHESLLDELSQMIFSVNLLEDIRQDAAVSFEIKVQKVNRIFETIPDVAGTADQIRTLEDIISNSK